VVCVEKIAGRNPHPMNTGNIPGCTYCRPQVASVGLTEAKAKEAGHEIKIGRFPFIGNGKAPEKRTARIIRSSASRPGSG
jgi:dihydrolipoamide dehydrogenase